MYDESTFVQIFDVTDAKSQSDIAGVLRSMGISVETPSDEVSFLVIAQSADRKEARAVFAQVMSIDFGAYLVRETGPGHRLDGSDREAWDRQFSGPAEPELTA